VPDQDHDSDATQRLLTEMPRALSTYGTPAHRLEEAMSLCAERLGVSAEFFSLPTAVFCAIGEGDATRSHMVRVNPGEVNLEKLDRVDAILGRILRGQLTPRQALDEIDRVRKDPPRYSPPAIVGCFGLAAACAARLFNGSWVDIAISAGVGVLVGLTLLLSISRRHVARVTEFLAGLIAALSAGLLAGRVPGLTPSIVMIASLIVLVPGLTLTVAINELATRNLVAGTSRLMGAVMILLSIGFGVGLGQALASPWLVPPVPGTPLPAWTEVLAILLVPLALTVLFQARPRDALVIVPASLIGYYGARLGSTWSGPELGACVGAFIVGVFGNAHARITRRPTAITLVPGIMLLVPGAIGFSSIASFLAEDVITGVQTAFRMIIVATGIVIGMLLANVLVPSNQSL